MRGARTQVPPPGQDGTPSHGVPRFPVPDGTPAHGFPQVRGGHPQQREPGGGWGEPRGRRAGAGPDAGPSAGPGAGPGAGQPLIPRQRQTPSGGPLRVPRQDYVDAFDADDVFTHARGQDRYASFASVPDWDTISDVTAPPEVEVAADAPPAGEHLPAKGAKGRTFAGIAAAAVTTVLAVVVAGQFIGGRDEDSGRSQSATGQTRDAVDDPVRGDDRPSASASAFASGGSVTLTYAQKMDAKYALGPELKGSGKFDAIAGIDKAPGKGQKFTYRVDVEQGLGLDGQLFAEAVQVTLNDERSWAHNGARTFERIHSGTPDFVITLASPGTTADWCAKSGLDTTEDNVSCDSAATERVMINAYRWAQGSETFGDAMYAYRQMLINHEVGHRLGYSHVTCDKDGDLAPVMQQQTKFLDHDGVHCLPNAWPYPGN